MKNLILSALVTILLISCNYKDIKLSPNDMFWHKYGFSTSKWIVIDTLNDGVIAYSENWLPKHAEYVSYTELSFSDQFKIAGKYSEVKDSIDNQKTVDTKIYSSIVQKVLTKSIVDGTYYIETQVWCDNKQRTALSLEYWEQQVVTEDRIESIKKSEYAKAEKVKAKVDRKLKENR